MKEHKKISQTRDQARLVQEEKRKDLKLSSDTCQVAKEISQGEHSRQRWSKSKEPRKAHIECETFLKAVQRSQAQNHGKKESTTGEEQSHAEPCNHYHNVVPLLQQKEAVGRLESDLVFKKKSIVSKLCFTLARNDDSFRDADDSRHGKKGWSQKTDWSQ